MKIEFENDYQKKIMQQTFSEPTHLSSAKDVQQWRSAWMQELGKWHSPYKLLLDVTQLQISGDDTQSALGTMLKFFEGFFLKKVIAYSTTTPEGRGYDLLPFELEESEDKALEKAGMLKSMRRVAGDFRSSVQIQNHFRQHVMELTFAEDAVIDTPEKVEIIKSKITNNLMQWHSKWSLLVDCHNLEVDPELHPHFERMFKFFGGFFMKKAIGYSPKGGKEKYPFKAYRARHRAAAELEGEGNFSGDEADCLSRKAPASK